MERKRAFQGGENQRLQNQAISEDGSTDSQLIAMPADGGDGL